MRKAKHVEINTAQFLSKEELYKLRLAIAKAVGSGGLLGLDLLEAIDKCDDYELLSVCNYLSYEYGRNEYVLDVDLQGLAETLNPDAWGFAYGVQCGDGAKCFLSDNWVYMDSNGYVKALDFYRRRAFMLERIADFTRDEVLEALEECDLIDGETIY